MSGKISLPTINIFYLQGLFHMSEGGCALVLQKDLEYWSIDELTMEPCCALKYYPEVDVLQSEKDGELKKKRKVLEQAAEEDFGNTEWAQWRSWLWNTIGRQMAGILS